jgi:enoyl-CoA hydratase
MNDDVLIEQRGPVQWITINREARRNAMNDAVTDAIAAGLTAASGHPDVRAVVLTGAGDKAFIGGANIDEMAQLASPEAARMFILKVHACCRAIRETPVPVIAAVNGWCLGAGLEIAAACDMRLAAQTAIFGMPEVKLGLPSVVEAALLPSLIGWGRTRRILMTGETFSAADAAAWGLVEETHPPALLFAAVEALLDKLLEAEPQAVRIQKALIRAWEDLPITKAIAAGVDAFEHAWSTDKPATAMARFLSERAAAKAR